MDNSSLEVSSKCWLMLTFLDSFMMKATELVHSFISLFVHYRLLSSVSRTPPCYVRSTPCYVTALTRWREASKREREEEREREREDSPAEPRGSRLGWTDFTLKLGAANYLLQKQWGQSQYLIIIPARIRERRERGKDREKKRRLKGSEWEEETNDGMVYGGFNERCEIERDQRNQKGSMKRDTGNGWARERERERERER